MRMWFGLEIDVVGLPPLGDVRSHRKFEPDRFGRFDVCWIQRNKQTDRQAKFIYRFKEIRTKFRRAAKKLEDLNPPPSSSNRASHHLL